MKKLFKWIFKSELKQLNALIQQTKDLIINYESQEKRIKNILQGIDVSVDVHDYCKYSPSWAIISLQGNKTDYIKFINLGDSDIKQIAKFLRVYEKNNINVKIDASPHASQFLKINKYNK